MIHKAFELRDKGLTYHQIAERVGCTNIGVYVKLRPFLDKGEMPPDKGSAYSLPACRDYIDNYKNMKTDEADEQKACDPEVFDPEALKIRVSFELGETARKAIDGLLALVGVRL